MKHFISIFTILCLLLGLAACSSEPVFDTTPEIEFLEITPTEIQQLTGEFTVSIRFQDGDGDLGNNNSENTNLYVADTRAVFDTLEPSGFSVPNLTPDTKNPSIQGTISIQVPAPPLTRFLTGIGPLEELTTFRIWMVDRAGNISNEIFTTPVLITND